MKHLTKKILVIGGIIAIISAVFSFVDPTTSFAAEGFEGRTGDNCGNFLGLKSWDCNVKISDPDSLKSGIWTIVANIVTDVTVIAAYLIVGFVIYGGYLYTMSGGDPNKVTAGKKTLTHAFIGLAIVILANVILNTISAALGANFSSNCITSECINPGTMVANALSWAIGVVGVVAVIFVVYGGITYTTSAGDPSKVQKAKQMILYALIGLAIVALAEIIVAFISGILNNSTSFEPIIIAKEYLL